MSKVAKLFGDISCVVCVVNNTEQSNLITGNKALIGTKAEAKLVHDGFLKQSSALMFHGTLGPFAAAAKFTRFFCGFSHVVVMEPANLQLGAPIKPAQAKLFAFIAIRHSFFLKIIYEGVHLLDMVPGNSDLCRQSKQCR